MKTLQKLFVFIALSLIMSSCDAQMVPGIGQVIIPNQNTTTFTSINYGYLYNGYAVKASNNFAPAGWHVPTKADVDDLIATVTLANGGFALKEAGLTHWTSTQTGILNSFNFSFVGGGYRDYYSAFTSLGSWGVFWYLDGTTLMVVIAQASSAAITTGNMSSQPWRGESVRLVKDDTNNTGSMTGNDLKVYRTVTVGNKVWTAQNSAETKYRDGTAIPNVTSDTSFRNGTTGMRCAYNNLESNALP